MEDFAEALVLIDSDEIAAGANRRAPPLARGGLGPEVVRRRPAARFVVRIVAVQRVKTDPQACRVRRLHEAREPRFVARRPRAGVSLAAELDDVPGIVPPPVIVRARTWLQLRESAGAVALARPGRTEDEQPSAHRHGVVEYAALRVGLSGEHEHRTHR